MHNTGPKKIDPKKALSKPFLRTFKRWFEANIYHKPRTASMFWAPKPAKKKEDDKEKQIKELKQVFPSVRRPNNDDNLFEIKFVVNNQYSSLRVFIPADFPNTRPVLQAAGPITHPWLDQFKQVNGSEKLMHWTRNSNLVEVVEESLSALLTGTNGPSSGTADPPGIGTFPTQYPAANTTTTPTLNVRPNSSPDLGNYPMAAQHAYPAQPHTHAQAQPAPAQYQQYNLPATPVIATGATAGVAVQRNSYSGPAASSAAQLPPTPASNAKPSASTSGPDRAEYSRAPSGTIPSLPSSFPELETLTTFQLQRLLSDPVALEAQVGSTESIKQMQIVVDQMRQSNEENARKNLAMETELHAQWEAAEGQQSALKVLVHVYKEKLAAAKATCEVPLDTVMKELKAVKNQLDSSSEEIGTNLIDGKVELPTFMTEYLEQRSKYHELCAKLDVIAGK